MDTIQSDWSFLDGIDWLQQGLHYATGVEWIRSKAIKESLMGLIGGSKDYTMLLEWSGYNSKRLERPCGVQ